MAEDCLPSPAGLYCALEKVETEPLSSKVSAQVEGSLTLAPVLDQKDSCSGRGAALLIKFSRLFFKTFSIL